MQAWGRDFNTLRLAEEPDDELLGHHYVTRMGLRGARLLLLHPGDGEQQTVEGGVGA